MLVHFKSKQQITFGFRKDMIGLDKNINENLLFSKISQASNFQRIQDTTAKFEAPHLIYGIWKIQEILF